MSWCCYFTCKERVAFSIHEVLICLVSEEWVDCLIRLAKLGYTSQRRNCVLSLCSHELFWVYFYALFHMKIMTICTLYIPEEKFSGHRTLVVGILSPSYKASNCDKWDLLYTSIHSIITSMVRGMVFNATFNNISVISYIAVAVSFIDGGNRSTRRKSPTCRKSLTNLITYWYKSKDNFILGKTFKW